MANQKSKSALRAAAVIECLEARRLLSATPLVMGYLVDYKIGGGSTGFAESGSGAITTDNLDWADLKQVNYFSLEPQVSPAYSSGSTTSQGTTSDGSLQATTSSGYDPSVQLPQLVADARNHGVSVFVTLGGGDPGSIYDMDALVNSPSAYGAFAASIKNFCNTYGLAGVDLDWEPTAQGGFTVTSTQIENFGNLVQTIKTDDPGLALSADTLGDPVAISTAGGSSTGTSAFMLNAVAVQYLDTINVEAYPVSSESESDTILANWKTYISGGLDVGGNTASAPVSKLQYGLDVDDDTSNQPAGVIENKVDLTLNQGFGGLFMFEADSVNANSALSRIGAEISKDTSVNPPTGTVSATLAFTSVTAAYDANAHAEPGTATGTSGENLAGLLSYTYQSAADGSVSAAAPTQPGTYEVFASFAGDSTYTPVASADTSKTIVIGPKSVLQAVPAAKLPTTALIAGQKIKPIHIGVKLANGASTLATGSTTVLLAVSTSPTGSTADSVAGQLSKKLNIKGNKAGSLGAFTLRTLPAGLSGQLYLILKLTDGTGATNVTTVGSINAAAPFVDLAALAVAPPPKARLGGKFAVTVTLMQDGNIPLATNVPVELFLSLDGTMTGAIDLGTAARHVSVQPGKKASLHLTATIPSTLPASAYHVIAEIDPANTLGDTNSENNLISSVKTVTVR